MIIPPQLMLLLGKYGVRIGIILVLTVALIVAYYVHRSNIYEEGYQDAVRLYEKRDSEFRAEANKQLERVKMQNEVKRDVDRENYLKAIKTYAEYSENIKREHDATVNNRVFVRVKTGKPGSCPDPVPGKTDVSKRITPANEPLDWAELGLEDRANLAEYKAEVKRMAFLCRQAGYAIKQNFTLK